MTLVGRIFAEDPASWAALCFSGARNSLQGRDCGWANQSCGGTVYRGPGSAVFENS